MTPWGHLKGQSIPPRDSRCPPASFVVGLALVPSLAPSLWGPEDKQHPRSWSQVPEVVSSGAWGQEAHGRRTPSPAPVQRAQWPSGFLLNSLSTGAGGRGLSPPRVSQVAVQMGSRRGREIKSKGALPQIQMSPLPTPLCGNGSQGLPDLESADSGSWLGRCLGHGCGGSGLAVVVFGLCFNRGHKCGEMLEEGCFYSNAQ